MKIVTLSADSEEELNQSISSLLDFLLKNPKINFEDFLYSLSLNKPCKKHRFFILFENMENLISILEKNNAGMIGCRNLGFFSKNPVVFMFPGFGSDYKFMGKQLYESDPVFKKYLDECNKIIQNIASCDVIDSYFYSDVDPKKIRWKNRSVVALNAIFSISYCLAKTIINFGIFPNAAFGYSMGEITAGVVSGVFSLTDAIKFLTEVGTKSYDLNDGALLAVKITENEIKKYINNGIEIASINSPDLIILGGRKKRIELIYKKLIKKNYLVKNIDIPCAYHTSQVSVLEKRLKDFLSGIEIKNPKLPVFSSCLGEKAKESEFCSVDYWRQFFSKQMNFKNAIKKCVDYYSDAFFVELGPSLNMASAAKKINKNRGSIFFEILASSEKNNEKFNLLNFLGNLWLSGYSVEWSKIQKNRNKIPAEINLFYDKSEIPDENKFYQKKQKAPKNKKEKIIYDVFRSVLLTEEISVDSSFFELGGDSLLAMQCISILSEKGLYFTPNYFFDNPSVIALASNYKTKKNFFYKKPHFNEIPLIPLQTRFFGKQRHWLNQKLLSVYLMTPKDISISTLKEACVELIKYHDALRLRYVKKNEKWIQFFSKDKEIYFKFVPIENKENSTKKFDELVFNEQNDFDLEKGPLIKFILVYIDGEFIFIVFCHHLCIDGSSYAILLKDLVNFYNKLQRNKKIFHHKKNIGFKEWSNYLKNFSEKLNEGDIFFWENQARGCTNNIPVDFNFSGNHPSFSTEEFSFFLSECDTEVCLRKAPFFLSGIGVLEILLLAFYRGFFRWSNSKKFYVDLRSHGRNIFFDDIDLSKTVGWVSIVYPLLIDLSFENNIIFLLFKIQSILKKIPYNGLSYGVLRYLVENKNIRDRIENLTPAKITFNYHGQLDNIQKQIKPFSMLKLPIVNSSNPLLPRSHLINIDAIIFNKKLSITITYSRDYHSPETIKKYSTFVLDEIKLIIDEINLFSENLKNQ